MNHKAQQPKRLAVIAITKGGVRLGVRVASFLSGVLYYPGKFHKEVSSHKHTTGAVPFEGSSAQVIEELFKEMTHIIWIGSLGVLVRFIAPHLKDKKSDPAVVCLDEAGQFAISVLSGHLGGANASAEKIGEFLDAKVVLTTGSDATKTVSVDLFGKEYGWKIESFTHVTAVSAAVVNRDPVALVIETGEKTWWTKKSPVPENITEYSCLTEAVASSPSALLLVTDRLLGKKDIPSGIPFVLYRPQSIVIGVGCNRKTPAEEIDSAIAETLQRNGLSPLSLARIVSIDKKRDEKGIVETAEKRGVLFHCYSAEELNRVKNIPNPSEYSMKYVGAQGVAEPAALLSANVEVLLEEKVKYPNTTTAVARVCFQQ